MLLTATQCSPKCPQETPHLFPGKRKVHEKIQHVVCACTKHKDQNFVQYYCCTISYFLGLVQKHKPKLKCSVPVKRVFPFQKVCVDDGTHTWWQRGQEDQTFRASLGYVVRACLKEDREEWGDPGRLPGAISLFQKWTKVFWKQSKTQMSPPGLTMETSFKFIFKVLHPHTSWLGFTRHNIRTFFPQLLEIPFRSESGVKLLTNNEVHSYFLQPWQPENPHSWGTAALQGEACFTRSLAPKERALKHW